jgi:Ni/Co efflux regulator RcnB
MSTIKTLGLIIAIAFAAASSASAQQGSPEANQQGNPAAHQPAANAPASGDSGTHHTAPKTGTAANTHKMARNQNDHRGKGHFKHYMGRAVYSYYSDGKHCHFVHPLHGPRVRVCP